MTVNFEHDAQGVMLYIDLVFIGRFSTEQSAWEYMVLNNLLRDITIERNHAATI